MQKLFPRILPGVSRCRLQPFFNEEGEDLPGEIDITVDWSWGMLTLDSHAPFAQAQEADQSRRLR